MGSVSRRTFLGGAAAGAVMLALPAAVVDPLAPAPSATVDPRVAALIDRSRDRRGKPHVARAAFVDGDRAIGTLPVAADELAALRRALASRDFTSFQERGLRLGGDKYVFIRDDRDDAGAVIHAVRRGAFATVRAQGDALVIATSEDGMVHGRAIEAVYQHVRRDTPVG